MNDSISNFSSLNETVDFESGDYSTRTKNTTMPIPTPPVDINNIQVVQEFNQNYEKEKEAREIDEADY